MADLLDLDPDELLTTTRAVRKRLDLTRPVARALVEECIEVALQAPTGSNAQPWQWVVVDDADKRAALAELYGRAFDPYIASGGRQYAADDPRELRKDAVSASAVYLREHLHEVPVHVIPLLEGRPETSGSAFFQASLWGSILPGVWSFMLAARARSLGTAWTTLHLAYEAEAADILGVDHGRWTQTGLFPLAYTLGTDFKPASRIPAADVVHWNTF